MEHTQVNIEHLRGAISTARTPAQWELEAMAKAIKVVMHDDLFQAALQRYAHGNGSSQAIAQAAVAATVKVTNDAKHKEASHG